MNFDGLGSLGNFNLGVAAAHKNDLIIAMDGGNQAAPRFFVVQIKITGSELSEHLLYLFDGMPIHNNR